VDARQGLRVLREYADTLSGQGWAVPCSRLRRANSPPPMRDAPERDPLPL